jgi:hypothetical protein
MAVFQEIWDAKSSLLDEYFASIAYGHFWVLSLHFYALLTVITCTHSEADAQRDRERAASAKIQSFFRGFRTRKYLQTLHAAATRLRAVWKGYRARCRFRVLKLQEVVEQQRLYYNAAATLIQKWFVVLPVCWHILFMCFFTLGCFLFQFSWFLWPQIQL